MIHRSSLSAARALAAAGVAVALPFSVAGCGGDKGYDSKPYCKAIADDGQKLDATAMLDGDEKAVSEALEVYKNLQKLAPPDLTKQWELIIRDLNSMLSAARGGTPVSDVDYPGFSEAFTAVEKDKQKRCD